VMYVGSQAGTFSGDEAAGIYNTTKEPIYYELLRRRIS